MKNDKIQNVILCILPVTIDFFHLTLHRNNEHQAKLELYLIKTLYYMENDKNTKLPPSVWKCIYRQKNGKVTIKGFNKDS